MGKPSWSLVLALGALVVVACSDEIDLPEIQQGDLAPRSFETDPDPRLRGDPGDGPAAGRQTREVFRPSPGGAAPLQTSPRRSQVLQVSCSPTSKVLFGRDLERAYENLYAEVDLVLQVADDRSCLGHVIMGRSDAAFVGVPLSKNERDKGLTDKVLGAQLVVPIVHPKNTVVSLLRPKLPEILDGRVAFWGDLGWENYQIQPVCLAADWRDDAPARLLRFDGEAQRTAVLLGSHERIIHYVSEDPRALGLVPLAVLKRNTGKVRSLQIDHVSPTIHNMDRGVWPLGTRFRVVYLSRDLPALRDLLVLLDSAPGQTVLERKLTLR